MRRQGIRTRLARLERQQERRPFPRRVFGIYDRTPDEVVGVEAEGVNVIRLAGEPLADLHARAFAMTGALCLFTLYVAARAASERNDSPSGYRTPTPAPEDAPRAGIGRVASVAELQRMAALPFPAERPI